MARVGVFGGTFDPVHIGHLVIAADVAHALDLDPLLLVVANDPWQKSPRVVASARDRLAMVEAAVEGVPRLRASAIEIHRGGVSLTADTLQELRAAAPDDELHLVVGADQAKNLDTWERVEEVRALAELVVVNRGSDTAPVPDGWRGTVVGVPALEVSSAEVRSRLASGRPIDFLVPPAAVRIIQECGLYPRGR